MCAAWPLRRATLSSAALRRPTSRRRWPATATTPSGSQPWPSAAAAPRGARPPCRFNEEFLLAASPEDNLGCAEVRFRDLKPGQWHALREPLHHKKNSKAKGEIEVKAQAAVGTWRLRSALTTSGGRDACNCS
mmetsp:Transcript_70863/g.197723  ORF Transcript_70863/g.197723 Transcript_70863/m.197723 type:complete len:133 (+) Transcript_70863:135-533(+)